MKIARTLAIICFSILVYTITYSADESVTITTYYPSPYGSYREMRATRVAIGDTYINGTTYSWDVTPPTIDADLVVEGRVGIGTVFPAAPLHIYTPNTNAMLNVEGSINEHASLNLFTLGDGTKNLGAGSAVKGWTITARGNNYQAAPVERNDLIFSFWDGSSWNPANSLFLEYDGNVGIRTQDPQGALDVVSTTGAFLPPRMTTAQRNGLSHTAGSVVYNTDTGNLEVYNGTSWVSAGGGYQFSGMFSTGERNYGRGSFEGNYCEQPNILLGTNRCGCPSGFTAYLASHIQAGSEIEYIYYCAR